MDRFQNEVGFNLNLFSKYRSEFFGLASCLIVLHHLTIRDTSNLFAKAYMFVRVIGAFGVDMFVFLAGIGMYYSYKKTPNVIHFYKRRLLRLIPAFFMIETPYCLYIYGYLHGDWKQFVISLSCIDFWMYGTGNWFVPAILFLYLLFPLIFHILNRESVLDLKYITPPPRPVAKTPLIDEKTVLFTAVIALSLLWLLAPEFFMATNRLWSRIPVYICGCLLAPYVSIGCALDKKTVFTSSLSILILSLAIEAKFALISVDMAYSIWARFVYGPLSISFMFLCAEIFERYKPCILCRILSFVGTMTFPIYLLNQKFISLMDYLIVDNSVSIKLSFLANIIAIILTFMISYVVKLVTDNFIRKIFGVTFWTSASKNVSSKSSRCLEKF